MESPSFKTARQRAGLSVDALARLTGLSPRVVSAIDNGQYDLLPAGIYARTAVRAVAAAVGMDAATALAAVQAQLPVVDVDLALVAELRKSKARPPAGILYLLAALVDTAVVLLIVASVTIVCSAVCQLMPTTLLKIGAAPIGVVCTTPVVLYFWLLGATDVRTVGPWLFDLEILPRSDGPLSLQGWARRGLSYVAREARFALMPE